MKKLISKLRVYFHICYLTVQECVWYTDLKKKATSDKKKQLISVNSLQTSDVSENLDIIKRNYFNVPIQKNITKEDNEYGFGRCYHTLMLVKKSGAGKGGMSDVSELHRRLGTQSANALDQCFQTQETLTVKGGFYCILVEKFIPRRMRKLKPDLDSCLDRSINSR